MGRAQIILGELAKRYSEDTIVRFNFLPTLRAKIAIDKENPSRAIEEVKLASSYELEPRPKAHSPGPRSPSGVVSATLRWALRWACCFCRSISPDLSR